MKSIVDELEVRLADDSILNSDHIAQSRDVFDAIQCLLRFKRDGNNHKFIGQKLKRHLAEDTDTCPCTQ